jgi:hypothetical protein
MTQLIPAEFELIAEIARRMKMEAVTEYGDNPDEELSDLRGFLVVVRGGKQVAIIHFGPGPEAPRQTCYAAAALMRADELFLVTDARMRTYTPDDYDETSETHQLGRYQKDWEAGRRDGLTECLLIQRMPKVGDYTTTMYPYERHRTSLRWLEHAGELQDVGGAIPDYTRQGYTKARNWEGQMKTILDHVAKESGLSPAEQERHTDIACARMLSEETGALVTLFGAALVGGDVTFVEGQEVQVG